jgi:predicted CoA-substrate-specific enzyme activase
MPKMDRTPDKSLAQQRSFYEGWKIGAVSIKRVRLNDDGIVEAAVRRHGGDPASTIGSLLEQQELTPAGAMVTGTQSASLLPLTYLPESICIEAALAHLGLCPDMVLSLGGESFVAYCITDGAVRRMVSGNRCAAGSGEFLVQQLGRMDMDLAAGMTAARRGRRVALASRCSVHCKSDATHKLNKGECTPSDIARSLLVELANKIATLVISTGWPHAHVVLAGGLAQSKQLIEDLFALLPDGRIEVPPESNYLEALGAAVAARNAGARILPSPAYWLKPGDGSRFKSRPALSGFCDRVIRIEDRGTIPPSPGMRVILGVDAGSTTTKAILLDRDTGQTVVGCYLRTHGNPVGAAFECVAELGRQMAGVPFGVLQTAVTGSGREMVSVYLDNCAVFNEILAHARAAREIVPDVDTLFEIGGQDAKFVALQAGIPIDYAMNDGCSAGTGSFLEEAAASDMQVPVEQIGPLALSSPHPISLGERCAAFINTEVRSALQQGVPREDVLAGLVYAIVENYLSRVIGARHIGQTVVLQGGVALNPAVAPAVAAMTGARVAVPPRPELMGCEGAALMARDLLIAGTIPTWDRKLSSFGNVRVEPRAPFTCPSCENHCEVQRIALNHRSYAFGGLCAKWEMVRKPKGLRQSPGRDLVALRHEMMFKTFAPPPPNYPRGRIGLPLALTTYELYPLYSRLLTELGYEVVLSRPTLGSRRTGAPMCYPSELMHAAVDDLLAQKVDFIFLPYLREFAPAEGHAHGYLCSMTQDIPGVIKTFFESDSCRILTPEMGLTPQLAAVTETEVIRMGATLGVSEDRAKECWSVAVSHQADFKRAYRAAVADSLVDLKGPAVVLVGRPYVVYAPEVNLSVPRKITTRGFTVIPGDALSIEPPANEHDVWHFTQDVMAAVEYSRQQPDRYICDISCFSCGPDAVMQHRLRRELEGQPFCFLEIDSHTAHAGIETRIGAFLDIIEARHQSQVDPESLSEQRTVPARIEQESGHPIIVTGKGRRLTLDASEVVHAFLSDGDPFVSCMLAGYYTAHGWRVAELPNTSAEILRAARKVCSGRECLPFLSMIGKVVSYLEKRTPGEVTAFHLLELEGPCQLGAWYDAAPLMFEQLGEENALVTWPNNRNNHFGLAGRFGAMKAAALIVSDILAEMRSSLACLAKEPVAALACLHDLEQELIAASSIGLIAVERTLRNGARRLTEVPLRMQVADAPKVLLFGGISRVFVGAPVTKFFEERGILIKTTEWSEFICLLAAQDIVPRGFSEGHLEPNSQCSVPALLVDLLHPGARGAAARAMKARISIAYVEKLDQRWRQIAGGSGLLFSPYLSFEQVATEGHRRISVNGLTEAPFIIGRYAAMLASGAFDGYINIGVFNCAPANTASAVIQSLSLQTDTPYAVIEADGDSLTDNQLRQLETVAAQCRRRREAGHATASVSNVPERIPVT